MHSNLGIIVFPGSNCDYDLYYALYEVLGIKPSFIWHTNTFSYNEYDFIFLPGGFSYGDYLRPGAIAGKSLVMHSVIDFANKGKPVLGICNGFQILCEAHLLPGALLRNRNGKFLCMDVDLYAVNRDTIFTSYIPDNGICIPINHADGRYYVDDDTLKRMIDKGQILFRYKENPNGSVYDIAGVINERGNVAGIMPHPEKYCEEILGSTDGIYFFQGIKEYLMG
jgi:phosphoribosylformylglycinamidine synthase